MVSRKNNNNNSATRRRRHHRPATLCCLAAIASTASTVVATETSPLHPLSASSSSNNYDNVNNNISRRQPRPEIQAAHHVVVVPPSSSYSDVAITSESQRKNVEKRQRREHDRWRALSHSHSHSQSHGQSGLHHEGSKSHQDEELGRRRLGGSSGLHGKGHSFEDEDVKPAPVETNNKNNDNNSNNAPARTESNTKPDPTPATNLQPYTRIAGAGSQTVPIPTRYPYMASFQMEGDSPHDGKFDYHICGGVLIAPDIFLSSAHCAYYTPPGGGDGASNNQVYEAFNGIEIGRLDLSDEGKDYDNLDSTTYRLMYENLIPQQMILHPEYNEETYQHDIMLVKVYGQSRYPPAQILNRDDATPQQDERITVLGWGATDATSTKKYNDQLREADMKAMTNAECRSTQVEVPDGKGGMVPSTLEEHVTDDMMCAAAAGRFTCYGDAGGPAILRDRGDDPDQDVVVGIISWGYGCVNSKYPAVMTRVSEHYDWIRTSVCRESTNPPEGFDCPGSNNGMELQSAEQKATVTLKLKLDTMSVETGFVIQTNPGNVVVAQRLPGYYRGDANRIIKEKMEIPNNQCYKLILLDSFGDGFCCDMGGGSGILYQGVDTGYYTGQVLAEVDGKFSYDNEGTFCVDNEMAAQSSTVEDVEVVDVGTALDDGTPSSPSSQESSGGDGSGGGGGSGGSGQGQGSGNGSGNQGQGSSGSGGSGSDSDSTATNDVPHTGKSGWNGPVTSPEFTYCNQFCQSNPIALTCGSHSCFHGTEPAATSDAEEVGTDAIVTNTTTTVPTEWVDDDTGYYITVQFQFDEHPEEVSWVLYDLTVNEVTTFVDFETYTQEEFANQELNVVVNVAGPDAGEKQYAFTVYDKSSNGLCCDYGEGYYNVFLGDIEDELLLLTDDEYGFSSSYYFTLFENDTNGTSTEKLDEQDATDPPSDEPTGAPTHAPTDAPTHSPTDHPTNVPTSHPTSTPTTSPTISPTTEKPTFPWEKQRMEHSSSIGARWRTETHTRPGQFNDIGGNQDMYKFDVKGANTVSAGYSWRRIGSVSMVVITGSFVLGLFY